MCNCRMCNFFGNDIINPQTTVRGPRRPRNFSIRASRVNIVPSSDYHLWHTLRFLGSVLTPEEVKV